MRRATLLAVALATAMTACGPVTPAEQAEANVATMRREVSADKLVERGRAFAELGDSTRAEEYFAAALDQGANAREVLPLLLQVCVQTGRYRSAIQHAQNHLRRHPDDLATRFVAGTLHAAVGDTKEAKEALSVVIKQRPDDAKAHYALAVLARDNENDIVTADRHFREYLRIEPNGEHAEEARSCLLKRLP